VNQQHNNTATFSSDVHGQTQGVKTLLGDPKKAIIKLSLPMIIAMSANTIYNLVDALWVSGLGSDALAAIGFVFPFFFMIMALATGLGIGGGSAISRRIGSQDKKGADDVASNTIVIMLIIATILTITLLIFVDDILVCFGCQNVLDMAIDYARIIFGGTIIIFFAHIAYAILRAEGDAKRTMYTMILGAFLNIILDPIFIYTLNLGVAGAAWATVLSITISSMIMIYWLFLKKDTYVSFTFRHFHFNLPVLKDIFKVGLPSSIQQLSMSITMIILNFIIVDVANSDGVAVYTTGWRVATIAILPLLGIATAVVSVTGAAYGARSFEKLKTSFMYAVKIGFIIEIFVGLGTFLLAPLITAVFTTAEGSLSLVDDLEYFLRIIWLFYPGAAFGIFSSAMFQGTGKGINALLATILRTLVLTTFLGIVFSYVFHFGLSGIWWSLVVANLLGSMISFVWAQVHLNKLKNSFGNSNSLLSL
jgi:putative MATE family efflux protein